VRLGSVAPRAILWDLDGVLVDSYEVWYELLRASARALGGREVTRAAFEAGWGQGIAADVERWFPERTIPELEAHYDAHFMDHAAHLKVDADAPRVVAALRARGLRQALITNTPSPLARAILAHARLELDDVVGGTDVANAKPAPDMVLEACRRLEVAPREAWVVGDSRFDRDAARAAGVHFVGVRMDGDARVERLLEVLDRLDASMLAS
jgi:phosphoglycolate phosphatase/AHBA synthesis associated protein